MGEGSFRVDEAEAQYAPLGPRTRTFALRVVRAVQVLPRDDVARTIGRQLLRSGTSVGANYRAAARSRSNAEFISKLGIVEEEADESIYWLELLADSGCVTPERVKDLIQEANELLAIVITCIKNARSKVK